MVECNGVVNSYVHNLQGDIVGIVDAASSLVVEYKYDAWGKRLSVSGLLATTLGKLNPFRYRGYVWDEEAELYYLCSRYYSPNAIRFINADIVLDSYSSVLHNNLFCYCLNNPIFFADSADRFAFMATGLGVLLAKGIESTAVVVVYGACVALTVVAAVEVTDAIADVVSIRTYEQE